MVNSNSLPLAIAAALSISALTGCSVGTDRIKTIPIQTAAASPTIIQEEVAFLSGTRTRYPAPQRQQSSHTHHTSVSDDSDLLYAASLLLNQPTTQTPRSTRTSVHVSARSPEKVARFQYRPATKANARVYKTSRKDPILDNPAYQQALLELAGLAPTTQPVTPRPASAVTQHYASKQTAHAPHEDMWNHIKQGYKMGNYGYRRDVQRFMREYGSDPERLQRISNRAQNYLHIVVNELKRRRMPTELALLPFVESAYVNTAHSHAGAAGMWQFIPSTGRLYGLKQNRGFDGRMDTLESTRAALDYLQKLHREFKGDWFLALAAYNAGEGRVGRAIRYNRARGRRTDFWSLKLPRETREYVPRLLAYKEIIARPHQYGFYLPKTPNVPKLVEIHINKPVNLRKAAAHAGLPSDTLTSLNPNFLKGVTTPRISKRILLPRHQAGRLAHVINGLPAERPVSIRSTKKRFKKRYAKSKKKSRYRTHRVKRGETLYRIAMRHGMTVNKLKRLNRMRSNRIKAGTRLRLI